MSTSLDEVRFTMRLFHLGTVLFFFPLPREGLGKLVVLVPVGKIIGIHVGGTLYSSVVYGMVCMIVGCCSC